MITHLTLMEVEILLLRFSLREKRNKRLKRTAGIAFVEDAY